MPASPTIGQELQPLPAAETAEALAGFPAPRPATPLAPNPWWGQPRIEPDPRTALEEAIRGGDRYRIAEALASMGVELTDDVLGRILLPPFGEHPVESDKPSSPGGMRTVHVGPENVQPQPGPGMRWV